jgi:DNA modification methylase
MIQLHNGHCVDIMRKHVADESVDLVVTSPPYDDLRNYEKSNDWSFDSFTFVAKELQRVLRPGGVIVWVVNDKTHKGSETGSSFRQALYFKEIGLRLHDTMIYMKDSCVWPEKTRYYPVFEYMFVLAKGEPKTFNPIKDRKNKWAGRRKVQANEYDHRGEFVTKRRKEFEIEEYGVRYNVWTIPTGALKTTQDKINHPAAFPESLARDHILSWSNPGDVVLDPFLGSGTTGKMAVVLDRSFIGIERVTTYFYDASERISRNCL